MKKITFNPFTGNFDYIYDIPEVATDPVSPGSGDAWVLRTCSAVSGGGKLRAFLGLGFPYTTVGSGGTLLYQLSYKTEAGLIKRVNLT